MSRNNNHNQVPKEFANPPEQFDEHVYQQANPDTEQFYPTACTHDGWSNRQRLYYHYMKFGGGDHDQIIDKPPTAFTHGNNYKIPPISLTVGVKNRFDQLRVSINSWIIQTHVREIVVIDWDSDDMDSDYLTSLDSRIKVIRVDDRSTYDHAQVLNTCLEHTKHDNIIKMDVDYMFNPYYQLNQWLDMNWETHFLTGHWNQKSMDNELGFVEKLNGFMCINKKHVHTIGGYNEQFVGYGWEDCELYIRLVAHGLKKLSLPIYRNFVPVYHLPHDDYHRTKYQVEKDQQRSLINNKSRTKYIQYISHDNQT